MQEYPLLILYSNVFTKSYAYNTFLVLPQFGNTTEVSCISKWREYLSSAYLVLQYVLLPVMWRLFHICLNLFFNSASHLWAQCEDCSKWRKLPFEVLMPSKWICSDNKWDPERWPSVNMTRFINIFSCFISISFHLVFCMCSRKKIVFL